MFVPILEIKIVRFRKKCFALLPTEWLSQNTHLSPVSFSGAFSLCCIVLVEIMWLKNNIGSHIQDVGQYYTESANEQFFAIPKSALCWGSTGLSWSHYGKHFLKDVNRDEDKWLMKVANRTKEGGILVHMINERDEVKVISRGTNALKK